MFKEERINYLIIVVISIIAFHFGYGLEKLDPTNINWLMSAYHDWGTHYLGWSFYRNDPWTFPLGEIQSYNYPVGTNIGFTDSIPLLAIILKPFSGFLPDEFQYFGFWLFLCCFLTGIYSFKIFQLYKTNRFISFLCIIIIMLNPVLLFRSFHPALCAHWLIIASLYNYLKQASEENADKINKNQLILLFLSTLITPYITAMIVGFNFILPSKHYIEKKITLKKAIFYFVISLVIIAIIWIIIGMLEFNNETNLASVESYNLFSFNLNSFFNSFGVFSKFFPDLGMTNPSQYEGFAYLGLGIMCIISCSFIYLTLLFYKRKVYLKTFKRYSLLFLLFFAFFLFAVTNEITFGNKTLIKLPLPSIIEKLGFIFRASGRFIWPVYYLIIVFSFLIFTKIPIKKNIKILILLIVMTVQFYDIQTLFNQWKFNSGTFTTKLSDDRWVNLMRNFDNVIVYPPFTYNYSMTYLMDYQDICYNALKAGKPISNAYVARANGKKAENFKEELTAKLRIGEIDNNRLILTTPDHIGDFKNLIKKDLIEIQKINGFLFVYKKNKLITSNFENDISTLNYIDSIKTHYKKYKELSFMPINLKLKDENKISFYLDNFSYDNSLIQLRGWAFLSETNDNKGDSIFLCLTDKDASIMMPLEVDKRTDITQAFKKKYLDDSGFYSSISVLGLVKNKYTLGIVIKDKTGKYFYAKTDKTINVK